MRVIAVVTLAAASALRSLNHSSKGQLPSTAIYSPISNQHEGNTYVTFVKGDSLFSLNSSCTPERVADNLRCHIRNEETVEDCERHTVQRNRAIQGLTRNSRPETLNCSYGGDVGSTEVGSQSGMPGFCYPVKQTDLQFKRRQF